jgi:hypothetical protein
MMGDMDHSQVRELLEDAAIEPGGLERLMAGDTPAASIVAGHLAGCPDCAEELERLRRSVGVIAPTVRSLPSPELRVRTLAYVAALGRPRGPAGAVAAPAVSAAAPPTTIRDLPPATAPDSPSIPRLGAPGRRGRLGALGALAAALIVAVTGTALVLNATHDSTTRVLTGEIDSLGEVARWTLRVDAQPDVRRVQLAGSDGSAATGTLVFSPGSTELVMVADGLSPAPEGKQYGCWVDVNGVRTSIGKMSFGGSLAYWVGSVPEIAGIGQDVRFGVSLIDRAATGVPGQQVLVSRD